MKNIKREKTKIIFLEKYKRQAEKQQRKKIINKILAHAKSLGW